MLPLTRPPIARRRHALTRLRAVDLSPQAGRGSRGRHLVFQHRPLRPSARPHVPLHGRDVGALLLLRHACAAGALHGEAPVPAARGRRRDRLRHAQGRVRIPVRSARRAAARLARLRPLHRPRLSDAGARRPDRRPLARPAPHRRARRRADGAWPLHDGLRAAVPVRAVRPHSRQRRVQAEHLDAGRRALRTGRSAPRPRVLDLLRRHQSRRVPGAAGQRHAGRTLRLALWLQRRRRRHDPRACHLSCRVAGVAPGRAHDAHRGGRRAPVRPRRVAGDHRALRPVRAGDIFLGLPTSRPATPSRCGPTATPTAACSGCSTFQSPGSRPSTRS